MNEIYTYLDRPMNTDCGFDIEDASLTEQLRAVLHAIGYSACNGCQLIQQHASFTIEKFNDYIIAYHDSLHNDEPMLVQAVINSSEDSVSVSLKPIDEDRLPEARIKQSEILDDLYDEASTAIEALSDHIKHCNSGPIVTISRRQDLIYRQEACASEILLEDAFEDGNYPGYVHIERVNEC